MSVQLALPSCAVPGCVMPGDPSRPCDSCLRLFGEFLRPVEGCSEPEQAPVLEAATVRRLGIAAGELAKPNQVCWLCELRRACVLVDGRWECAVCREVK